MRSSTFVTTYSTALLTRPPLLEIAGGVALGMIAGGVAVVSDVVVGAVVSGLLYGITPSCVPLK